MWCAIPPDQVVRGADAPDGPTVSLFGDEILEAPETWLEVRLGADRGWLPVRELSIDELERPEPLTPVAASVVRLPHVVGWADRDGGLLWLVDLDRYRARAPAR